ncbi:DUF885 domain-containing protein [Algicola sagamiensis]|uniref:DUF885 domain-containing protein n=1 Tax=Algicola sagamiensis TaxID=163869 RepID=UPI00037BE629|nr:DUF885 domain-containing protein [Algicola sagamiensis]
MKRALYHQMTVCIVSIFMLAGCASTEKQSSLDLEFQQLANQIWHYELKHDPMIANPSDNTRLDQLTDLSQRAYEIRHDAYTQFAKQLNQISVKKLSHEHQINYSVIQHRLQNNIDLFQYMLYLLPMNASADRIGSLAFLPNQHTFKTKQDYLDYQTRLAAIPKLLQQQQALFEHGLSIGMTQPRITIKDYVTRLRSTFIKPVKDNPLYQPFVSLPPSWSSSEVKAAKEKAESMLQTQVQPAFKCFIHFMEKTYQPKTRTMIGAHALPQGRELYANRISHYSTLNHTADDIHHIGLSEVKRIREEMHEIIRMSDFQGNFKSFLKHLRTHPKFYARTKLDLIKQASYLAKKMDASLPKFFKNLPRRPYGVAPVPDEIAPSYTTGRYIPPSRNDQPGYYWVNTSKLKERPLYVLEALTLHEAVPGHHLQISLAAELEHVPEYRRRTYLSAFGEGWGLYSEWLGKEAGFYQDPYSEFGRLSYEMWRACRLVVDTGIHAKGWSRQQAIDFIAENSALSMHNIRIEVDRYIVWPGQAVSYKLGEMTIKSLREKAQQQLGLRFDIREFHDVILRNGSVPLPVLEQEVTRYIQQNTI